jgi:hypothetical protein
MHLGHAPTYEDWAADAGLAGRIVTYADKRARLELLSLDERFAKWHAHYPDSPPLDVAHERARQLEREICDLAGIAPEEVGLEAWVSEALSAPA